MDRIQKILSTFSKPEVREFRVFINRMKNKRNRKDLELFNVMVNELQAPEKCYLEKFKQAQNAKAYHALRLKLLGHIMDYLYLKGINSDNRPVSQMHGYISLANHLFDHSQPQQAWHYLRKAEVLAENLEQYETLNLIYNLAIKESPGEWAPPLKETLRKRKANKLLADENERIAIAQSITKERLMEVRTQGKELNFEKIIVQILDRFELQQTIQKRASMLYQIMSIFRNAIIATKEYYLFETFVIGHYKRFALNTGFAKNDLRYKANLLYMIAHTLYRNKKFNESQGYLDQMHLELPGLTKANAERFYVNYASLSAANLLFSGNLHEAISTLETLKGKLRNSAYIEYSLNNQLNLAIYFFYKEAYSRANSELLQFEHSNAWYEKKMGIEWVLRKELLTVLLQYEMGNDDIALNRIRALLRNFKIIEKPNFLRVKVFLGLVKAITEEPQKANSSAFINRVEASFDWVPMVQEDLQAVIYYAWLKSKMVQLPHYDTLLQLTGEV